MTEAVAIKVLLGIVLALLGYIWKESRKSANGIGAKVSKIIALLQEKEDTREGRQRITNLFFK